MVVNYRTAPMYSPIFPHIPKYSLMFHCIPFYPPVFPACLFIPLSVPACCCRFLHVPACLSVTEITECRACFAAKDHAVLFYAYLGNRTLAKCRHRNIFQLSIINYGLSSAMSSCLGSLNFNYSNKFT